MQTIEDLEVTNAYGKPYEYTVDEVQEPLGYTKSITGNTEEGFLITNTYGSELVDITLAKEWVGGPSPRPRVEIQLLRNIEGEEPQPIDGLENAVLEDGESTYTWTGLDKTDADGKLYTYSVKEINVPEGYTESYDGLKVTNTFTDTVGLQIQKTNEEGAPLPGAKFGLFDRFGTGLIKEETTLYDGKLTFTGLKPGQQYVLRETLAPFGYIISNERYVVNVSAEGIVEVIGNSGELDSNPLTIANKPVPPIPDPLSLMIQKTDEESRILPGAVFTLFNDKDEEIKAFTTAYDGKVEITRLEVGKTYTLRETTAPAGYVLDDQWWNIEVKAGGNLVLKDNLGRLVNEIDPLVVINKAYHEPEPEITRVVVHKTWANLLPDDKPENHIATFVLSPGGEEKEIVGNGTVVFENLPKYDANSNLIEYTVTEKPIYGFEVISAGNANDGFVFTNYPTQKFGVVLQKVDEVTEAVLQGAEFDLWGKLKPEVTKLPVRLHIGTGVELTESISARLVADGNPTDKVMVLDALSQSGEFDIQPGEATRYSLEVQPIEGLSITVLGGSTGFVIKLEKLPMNSLQDRQKVEALVHNIALEKQRLSELENLSNALDNLESKISRINEINELLRHSESVAKPDYNDLNKRDSVEQQRKALEGTQHDLQQSIQTKVDGLAILEANINELSQRLLVSESEEAQLIQSEIQNLNIQKSNLESEIAGLWEEVNGVNEQMLEIEQNLTNISHEEQIRMSSTDRELLIRELERLNEEVSQGSSDAQADALEKDRILEKLNLLEQELGLREELMTNATNFEIHNSETIDIELLNNNRASSEYVLVGKFITDQHGIIAIGQLEAGDYYFIETKAPNGYEEQPNEKYEFSVPNVNDSSEPVVVHVTNEPITPPDNPKYIEILGQKIWEGDTIFTRPLSIVVELYKDGEKIAQVSVSALDGWKYGFGKHVEVETDGTEHRYEVKEVVPEGYVASYDGFNIINRKEENPEDETIRIKGRKTWVGVSWYERPSSIEVILYRDGQEIDRKTVSSLTLWKYDFGDKALVGENGIAYHYEVKEVVPDGYEASYDGFNITNTKSDDPITPNEPEYTTIRGEKTWVGDEELDRPESITIKLIDRSTNHIAKTLVVTREEGWKYSFENVLVKDSSGKEYSYRMKRLCLKDMKQLIEDMTLLTEKLLMYHHIIQISL
ncbi:MAG: Cna B-type domain-containing protein [Tissierellia bacterium]|nr:Cna B-type domain-containing protein [Tissierellia bacterium]